MSLWLHRRSIVRAVAGDLPQPAQARLRRHLAGCAQCRAHYDAASLTIGAGSNLAAAARERERLRATIEPAAQPPARVRARPGRRWIAIASAALVPAAAIVLLRGRGGDQGGDRTRFDDRDVTARGAAESATVDQRLRDETLASLVLRLYARKVTPGAAAGPVRLVGEVPGSGELRAGRDDEIQIAYVGLATRRLLLLTVHDERGRTIVLHPPGTDGGPGRAAPIEPTQAPRLLGPPLSASAIGSRLRISATVSRGPDDPKPVSLTALLVVDR